VLKYSWVRNRRKSEIADSRNAVSFSSRAQPNAFHCRDARLQSRLFARENQSLRHSPNSNRLSRIVSDGLPVTSHLTV
jgi:hypothetical protein